MQSYDPSTASRRGWPAKALAFNPTLRGTSGLRDLYAELQATLAEVVIDSNWRLGMHRGVRMGGSSLSVMIDEHRLLRCVVPTADGAGAAVDAP